MTSMAPGFASSFGGSGLAQRAQTMAQPTGGAPGGFAPATPQQGGFGFGGQQQGGFGGFGGFGGQQQGGFGMPQMQSPYGPQQGGFGGFGGGFNPYQQQMQSPYGPQMGGYGQQMGGFGQQMGGYGQQMGGFGGGMMGGFSPYQQQQGYGPQMGGYGQQMGGFNPYQMQSPYGPQMGGYGGGFGGMGGYGRGMDRGYGRGMDRGYGRGMGRGYDREVGKQGMLSDMQYRGGKGDDEVGIGDFMRRQLKEPTAMTMDMPQQYDSFDQMGSLQKMLGGMGRYDPNSSQFRDSQARQAALQAATNYNPMMD